jgi:sialate O-acetylesterase
VWADARIDGESVVVSHPSVPEPAAVRYAWSSQFPWANLFNRDGLPAQPFRTDRW